MNFLTSIQEPRGNERIPSLENCVSLEEKEEVNEFKMLQAAQGGRWDIKFALNGGRDLGKGAHNCEKHVPSGKGSHLCKLAILLLLCCCVCPQMRGLKLNRLRGSAKNSETGLLDDCILIREEDFTAFTGLCPPHFHKARAQQSTMFDQGGPRIAVAVFPLRGPLAGLQQLHASLCSPYDHRSMRSQAFRKRKFHSVYEHKNNYWGKAPE
ncbi:hypothetical protein H920_08137 [Fukomys damarensis]|uniref:Uncharacterized protein n=1 Tax=Fukomys damarensis TaxID=885580 RepID=A0A091E5Q9_FUKDA|nr:hypothetical protein H920_08137 [Fukomys damarensis]